MHNGETEMTIETCCLCGKPIIPMVDPVHGAYSGAKARHWDCHEKAHPPIGTLFDKFDKAYEKAMGVLIELRKKTR